MRVGWIGLGAMGLPMATRLVEQGLMVVAFDVKKQDFTLGPPGSFAMASSVADVARQASVVVIMVSTPEQADDVLFAEGRGLVHQLSSGDTVVIMSTVGPDWIDFAGQQLGARGIALVDAPVSGGTRRAATGELLVFASGTEVALSAAGPVLTRLAVTVSRVGEQPGDGQRLKVINQLLCGVHIAAAAEALALAASMGLEPGVVLQTVQGGAAASFMLSDRGPRMLQQEPEVRSTVDIFVKDMGLVTRAARVSGAASPLADAASALFAEASRIGLGSQDDSCVYRVLNAMEPGAYGRGDEDDRDSV